MSVTSFTSDEQKALHDPWQWTRFLFFPISLVCIWALAVQYPSNAISWQIGWTLAAAYCMFCWTSCFHETSHQTLTSNRSHSIWLGRLLGTAILVPYNIYRESHIRHHAYLNKPYDWELWPYSDPKTSLWFRRVFVWFDLIFGVLTAPYTFGRIFFHRDSPITDPKLRRTIWWEYAGCVVVWGSVIGVCAAYGWLEIFVRAWLIPHCVAGVWQNGRKFTEHLGMKSYDPLHGTRTVVGQNWFTRMCTYLNFDIFIHGPHHRHPRVPHRTLREKMNQYAEKQPELQYPMFRTYTGAVLDMIPYMFRNPGVGMNVGAEAPGDEKKQTENFVQDVVEEVLSEEDRITQVTVG